MNMNREPAVPKLNQVMPILQSLKSYLYEHRINRLGILDSYARGEHRNDSDILVEHENEHAPSLYQFIELRDYLSELFSIKVDVVTRNSLKARISKRVLAKVIYLWIQLKKQLFIVYGNSWII